MDNQRKRARAARQDVDSMQVQSGVLGEIHEASEFIGYDQLDSRGNSCCIVAEWCY